MRFIGLGPFCFGPERESYYISFLECGLEFVYIVYSPSTIKNKFFSEQSIVHSKVMSYLFKVDHYEQSQS